MADRHQPLSEGHRTHGRVSPPSAQFLLFCIVGAVAINNAIFDIWILDRLGLDGASAAARPDGRNGDRTAGGLTRRDAGRYHRGSSRSDETMATRAENGLLAGTDGRLRCWWHGGLPDYQRYHDEEWGLPVDDDRRLFEKLCLEGFQSGLSWLTILRKRDNFRKAFDDFDVRKVARYGESDVIRLLADAGIVRHRGKIEATINNAGRALELQREFGSLAAYFWQQEPGADARPSRYDAATLVAMPWTAVSQAISKDLKRRGWRFVGPTTVYAFMQAMGLVNDHIDGCCIRAAVEARRTVFRRPRSPAERASARGSAG